MNNSHTKELVELKEFLIKTGKYNKLLLNGMSPEQILKRLLEHYKIDEGECLSRSIHTADIDIDSYLELHSDIYAISYAYKKLYDSNLINEKVSNKLLKSRIKKMERASKRR